MFHPRYIQCSCQYGVPGIAVVTAFAGAYVSLAFSVIGD